MLYEEVIDKTTDVISAVWAMVQDAHPQDAGQILIDLGSELAKRTNVYGLLLLHSVIETAQEIHRKNL